MNKTPILFTLLLSTAALPSAKAGALSGVEIMTRNEDARKVREFEARSKLVSGNLADKSEKTKEFSFSRKVQQDGIHNSTFTRFHSPAEVKNEGILIVENGNGKNEVLLYLPAYKKVRRVESQQQSGSFMGSVFSYSDIAAPHVDEYSYRVLKEEKCPDSAGISCSVIECTPATEEVKERTGYSKSVVWIRADNFMLARAEYYDLTGILMKKLEARDTRIVDPKEKKWLSHSLSIQNLKTGDFTRLDFQNVKVNRGIPDGVFTQQNLQKVN